MTLSTNSEGLLTLRKYMDANKEMITVFECKIHDAKIIDTLKENILGMIEVELENLENDEFDVLKVTIRRKQMTQDEYENTPEFEGY